MSAETIKNKLAKKENEIKKAKVEIKKLRAALKDNIGKIADDAGLLNLEISDKDLKKEFKAIFDKYQKKA